MSLAEELARCRPWIEAALEYSGGTHSFDDIAQGIASGHMQLWPAPRGCAVTQLVVYPQKDVLHIFLAGGELDQLLDGLQDAAAWGRAQGCKSVTLSGRLGWQRALAAHGFKHSTTVLEMEIS